MGSWSRHLMYPPIHYRPRFLFLHVLLVDDVSKLQFHAWKNLNHQTNREDPCEEAPDPPLTSLPEKTNI